MSSEKKRPRSGGRWQLVDGELIKVEQGQPAKPVEPPPAPEPEPPADVQDDEEEAED